MEIKNKVVENVTCEFERYKEKELQKSAEQLFFNSGKNRFYISLKEYFDCIELDEKDYKILLKDGDKVLENMWSEFVECDGMMIGNLAETEDFVEHYLELSLGIDDKEFCM